MGYQFVWHNYSRNCRKVQQTFAIHRFMTHDCTYSQSDHMMQSPAYLYSYQGSIGIVTMRHLARNLVCFAAQCFQVLIDFVI